MPFPANIAPPPEWLLHLIAPPMASTPPHANAAPVGDRPSSVPVDNGDAYVDAALRRELARLAAATTGQRNHCLNKAAYALGRFVGCGALGETLVTDELTAAARALGLPATEIAATINSGLGKGKAKPAKIPARRGRPPRATVAASQTETASKNEDGPYAIEDGRLVYHVERIVGREAVTSSLVVCDLEAHIAEEMRAEDGRLYFNVAGRNVHGRDFAFEIAAEEFADERRLKARLTDAAGAESVVRKGMAAHLAPALGLLSTGIARTRRYTRTGWAEIEGKLHFLMPGALPPAVSLALPRKIPYSFEALPAAQPQLARAALAALFHAQRTAVTAVAITVAFQAPLARLAGWRNERYALFIAGHTGSFKSSWAQVLMTLYGPRFMHDDLLIKWGEGATRNAIMALAAHAPDLPLLIDNYKPSTGGGAKDFVNLIHNILEGGEKERLTRGATLRESRPVGAWPVVTGEDVPDTDAASLARVLVVPFARHAAPSKNRGAPPGDGVAPTNGVNPHLARAQELAPHLCALGAAWLAWLQSDDGAAVAANAAGKFAARRAIWASYLRQRRDDMANINRVASNLASNELTWEVMGQCPALRETILPFAAAHALGLREVGINMALQTASAQEATRYLDALAQLLASERFILVPRHQCIPVEREHRVLGWCDDDGIYLLPELAIRAVCDLLRDSGALGGISKHTLHRQLDALGKLAGRGHDGAVTVKWCNQKAQRVLHLKPDAFEAE